MCQGFILPRPGEPRTDTQPPLSAGLPPLQTPRGAGSERSALDLAVRSFPPLAGTWPLTSGLLAQHLQLLRLFVLFLLARSVYRPSRHLENVA